MGRSQAPSKRARAVRRHPRSSSDGMPLRRSRMRMTTDSPPTSGSVTTRRSTGCRRCATVRRPSCGARRSAMSRSAMILMRETRLGDHRARDLRGSDEHAVDAELGAQVALRGGEVDVRGAPLDRLVDDRVDEADDRALLVVGVEQLGALEASSASRVLVVVDDVHRVAAAGDALDRAARCPRAPRSTGRTRAAGDQRDVVDRRCTFDGSASATSRSLRRRRSRSGRPGSGARPRARRSDAARRSTSKADRSTWSRPWRSATTRESWSAVSTPLSSSTRPVVRPVVRATLTAASTTSRVAKPRSTTTSPIRREEKPRCVGAVRPRASALGFGCGASTSPSRGSDAARDP